MRPKTMSVETHEVIYSGPVDEVSAAIAEHNGDFRETVRSLLLRERTLLERLSFAEGCMGRGFTRGWKPSEQVEEPCDTQEA
ncbi:hypothetical protein QO002_006182 [Pararhizobium capsulatum DSM 1112]|uniref:Dehydrogenase n=1 Tax=Pararhizobium capsulatum DSM 1112 TaxID=1121113 RepID=A0ABU0C2S4_9HYPH|nr:hypothetical protein [Pararhizobium capsulatum DSM 1112]